MPVAHFSEEDFNTRVLKANKPALVDFFADWCGPCRVMAPIIEELAHELGEKVIIGKVDVDANQALAEKYHIMSIPTIIIVKGGQVVDRLSGVQNKSTLIEKLKALLWKGT